MKYAVWGTIQARSQSMKGTPPAPTKPFKLPISHKKTRKSPRVTKICNRVYYTYTACVDIWIETVVRTDYEGIVDIELINFSSRCTAAGSGMISGTLVKSTEVNCSSAFPEASS